MAVVTKKPKLSKTEKARRGVMVATLLKGSTLELPLCNGAIPTVPVSASRTGWYIVLKAKRPGRGDDYGSLTAWLRGPDGTTKLGVVDEELHGLGQIPGAGVSMAVLGWLNDLWDEVNTRMMKEEE